LNMWRLSQLVANSSHEWHHCWKRAVLVGQVTIFDHIDFLRVWDKWEYILHDRSR
jgi:hypothetical protein